MPLRELALRARKTQQRQAPRCAHDGMRVTVTQTCRHKRGGRLKAHQPAQQAAQRALAANSRPRSESSAMSMSSDSFPMSLSRTHPPATRSVTGSAAQKGIAARGGVSGGRWLRG